RADASVRVTDALASCGAKVLERQGRPSGYETRRSRHRTPVPAHAPAPAPAPAHAHAHAHAHAALRCTGARPFWRSFYGGVFRSVSSLDAGAELFPFFRAVSDI